MNARRGRGRKIRALAVGTAAALLLLSGQVASQPMTLNLKDADLSAVIATVAEMTGKNFIVDPRVKGKVTVVSSQPLETDQIYSIFLSILSVHGYAAVPTGTAIKIVPEVSAKQSGSLPSLTPNVPLPDDQYVTQVIGVNNVNAAQLVPILRPLVAQQGHLAAVQEANMLVIAADAANVQRITDLVKRIDSGEQDGIEAIPLLHASATEVVRVVQSLRQGSGGGAAGAQGGGSANTTLAADSRTNTVLISGSGPERLRLKALITHLDTPMQQTGNTEVIYLRYAEAETLAKVLSGVSETVVAAKEGSQEGQASAGGGSALGEKVSIQPEPATNALVITAPPDILNSLRAVVRQLDVRRAQVLVEAVIAEISYDKAKEFGVQWGYNGSSSNEPVGLVNFNGSNGLLGLVSGLATDSVSDAASALGNGLNLVVGDTQGGSQFGAFVRALASDADANILSTPTLVTLDNEEAEIVVGQNVPFITGSYTSTGSTSTSTNPFQTIEREDVGITLRIKPQINEGDAVKLEIVQEVSSLVLQATRDQLGTADIVTNKRSIKTVVMVDNGQAVVLGGLMQEELTQGEDKVPVLGDIPILGNLFGYQTSSKTKRNLMVFLHPVILRDASQSAAISGEKYNIMRTEQIARQAEGIKMMPGESTPLLPEWDKFLELPPPFDEHSPEASATPAPLTDLPPPPPR